MLVFFVDCIQIWYLVKLLCAPSTTPAMFGGMLFGYVMYDCTHYYMHHSQPKTAISKNLKVNALLLLSIVVAVAIAFTVVTTVITVIVIRIAAVAVRIILLLNIFTGCII
ncbi:hypothetical protein Lalb_Chr13g0291471 [Lupinus albus]|uniref:Uncharacterized protein n=1 Tax=Lupinus albus TaxID=3870 RepID=A0A6A4PHJ6_LUPAL|nr:hypothetical protein Lalb_Chr13g0291471 [Lupinus albus]